MWELELKPPPVAYSEKELITLLKKSDEASFNYLYDNYSGVLYTIVLQIVCDKKIAKELLQDVFVKIWFNIDRYDYSKGRLFTWMLCIARNLSIDMLRSKAYKNNLKNKSLPDDECNNLDDIMISRINIDCIGLKKAVEKLRSEQEIIIDLAYFKGYTHKEIEQIEKIPIGMVKTRLSSLDAIAFEF